MPAFLKPLFLRLKQALKNWTRPTPFAATAASLADLTRTRADLLIENAFLRHQIVVLTRHSKRPQLANTDRFVLVLLARCTQFWEHSFVIFQPQTLCWLPASSAAYNGVRNTNQTQIRQFVGFERAEMERGTE